MTLKISIFYLVASLAIFRHTSAQCPQAPSSNCIVHNGLQIKTYDGNIFSFNSGCGYTLVSIPAEGLVVNYMKTVVGLQVNYNDIVFFVSISTGGVVSLTKDGVAQSIPSTSNGVDISKPGRMVIIKILGLGMKIRYDGNTVEIIQSNQYTYATPSGICGNNNGCTNDDLVLPDGQTAISEIIWVNSWALSSCTASPYISACVTNPGQLSAAQTFCANLFAQSEFTNCQIYSPAFEQICESNYCGCTLPNRKNCMCDMLDSLVRTCEVDSEITVSWRSATLCPIQCSIIDQSYSRCAPNYKELTCGEDEVTNPALYDCEEGCYCPTGLRLYNSQCLLVSECPCLYEGTYYPAGTTINQDCNSCTCTNAKWVCTTHKCVAEGHCNGDPHCQTFDGWRYDFMGKCMYYMVRGIGYDIICDHYVWNGVGFIKNFQSSGPSYCARMIIEVQGDVIELRQNKVVFVNGERVRSLPFVVSGIKINQPSSEWVVAVLRNKVRVAFDGRYRTSVTIPSSMQGRVKGLLGTYTGTTADDFTMPDNTLAPNANVFGHSWKVPGSCVNENVDEADHPCITNPSKVTGAQQACSVITGTLFAGCSDDPTTDYNDCVYDGCNCADDDAQCLCAHFASQGEKCSAKGINVDWRATITECAITCPTGQTYQTCGNSCTRTCADIFTDPTCEPECADGCNCPPGQALNYKDECVQISQCLCIYNDIHFPPGYIFVEMNTLKKYECVDGTWTITDATITDINTHPNTDTWDQQCDPNEFLAFAGCKQTNTKTCLNKHLDERPNFDNCVSGCECLEGFLMDTELGMCVRPEDCPCMYKGISYPDNAVISNRDEICTCVLGFLECTAQTDYWATCSMWGDNHVKTFDETVFSFDGHCEYVLFRHAFGTGTFRVTVETSSCDTGSCVAAVYINHRAANGHIDNIFYTTSDNHLATTGNLVNLVVTDLDVSIIVDVVGLGVRVVIDRSGWVHVHITQSWLTQEFTGLCGKYDNDASNDLEIPGQTITGVTDFVNHNKLDRQCGESTDIVDVDMLLPDDPCNYLQSDAFITCRHLVPVDEYSNTCFRNARKQQELPPGQRKNHYCRVISAYAQECNNAGAPVNWRSSTICPLECPVNKEHFPCDTPCPKETCQNTVGYNCADKVCAEACNIADCPEGMIYADATYQQCIAPSQCPVARRNFGSYLLRTKL